MVLAQILSEGIIACSLSRRYYSVKKGAQDIMGSNLSTSKSYYLKKKKNCKRQAQYKLVLAGRVTNSISIWNCEACVVNSQ